MCCYFAAGEEKMINHTMVSPNGQAKTGGYEIEKLSVDELVEKFKTSMNGLPQTEAENRLEEYGLNAATASPTRALQELMIVHDGGAT
jgi:hypothetical protein